MHTLPAAFIDRDGVINEELDYVHRIEDFHLLPGVIDGLRLLSDAGYALVVVTNQAGIGRGLYGEAEFQALTAHMQTRFASAGVHLAGVYHCPHHPTAAKGSYRVDCDCRKPRPGMLLRAAQELGLDLPASVIVGDKLSDLQAGRAAGVRHAVLVESGHAPDALARQLADHTATDLRAAASWIVGARTPQASDVVRRSDDSAPGAIGCNRSYLAATTQQISPGVHAMTAESARKELPQHPPFVERRALARVDPEARARLKDQRAFVIWFTGLSGAGKSTLATALEQLLHREGRHTVLLDGDDLRRGLNSDLGFGDAARSENMRRVGHVAKLMADAGLIVLVALISPFRADRGVARALLPPGNFIEVHVHAPLSVVEARDTKGLYGRARQGLVPLFTGISSPYEAPEHAEVTIDTSQTDVGGAAAALLQYLRSSGLLNPPADEVRERTPVPPDAGAG